MKKLLIASALMLSSSVFAHGPYRYYHHHYHGHNNWVAPLIVGGMIGYAINRPQIVYTPPPVVYPQITTIPSIQTQNCTPWTEIQNQDGSITRTRTCSN